ncbi:MAG TPA: DUF4391 domain-containing protein [Pirellulaceae bacterium]|nr:DUF4391 domain-containing protein [Pirellulaceae bacterium]HMO93558.1 DUF4391 domain-containing protein [Pirellulaceae bacterium]HMP71107.1 DUF4391 domain-containing protein [Pirellulaceae bacterium]
MNNPLFAYPRQTSFNRVLPKSKIYNYAKPSRSVRERFVNEVDQIVWKHKLSPETLNLPSTKTAPEIQIFGITLRTDDLSESVLRTIDKAISFPIFYELNHQGKCKISAAYKRPSETDSSSWVVDSYFESEWQPETTARQPLPVALNLGSLYEQMLRQLITLPARADESLKALVERNNQLRSKQSEFRKVEQQLSREKQFNRKVELNRELRMCQQEIDRLMGIQ